MTKHLLAISPLDGRYCEKLADLRPFFSEYGLIRYRLWVEIHWLQALLQHTQITEISTPSQTTHETLNHLFSHFSIDDAAQVKTI